jgi:hypothetical protein
MTTRTSLVLAAWALCAAGCGGDRAPQGGGDTAPLTNDKKLSAATIFLLPGGGTGTQQCRIRTAPQRVEAKPKRDWIEWTIVNACNAPSTAEVEIVFGSGQSPFESSCNLKGNDRIRCRIRDDASNPSGQDHIKYRVRLSGLATDEDPEIEIVM